MALIVVVYGVSLGHQFVFDDTSLVVDNELVQLPLSRAGELLTGTSGGISYRPLRIFSYMVDYRLGGGLDPAVFHASNLVWHALTTVTVYALAYLTVGSLGGALAAASLFAVHPLGSEAVVYVAGRRDLLCTLFVLLALLCWCRLLGAGSPGRVPRSAGVVRRGQVAGRFGTRCRSCAAVAADDSARPTDGGGVVGGLHHRHLDRAGQRAQARMSLLRPTIQPPDRGDDGRS